MTYDSQSFPFAKAAKGRSRTPDWRRGEEIESDAAVTRVPHDGVAVRFRERDRFEPVLRYEKEFELDRQIELPDWELLETVEAWLGPSVVGGTRGPYTATASDASPIKYNVSLPDLRAAIESSEQPVAGIRVLLWPDSPSVSVEMYFWHDCRVSVSAPVEDKAVVTETIARLAELVSQAVERYAARHPEVEQGEAEFRWEERTDEPPPPSRLDRIRRYLSPG